LFPPAIVFLVRLILGASSQEINFAITFSGAKTGMRKAWARLQRLPRNLRNPQLLPEQARRCGVG
jgi:hypothetical protein